MYFPFVSLSLSLCLAGCVRIGVQTHTTRTHKHTCFTPLPIMIEMTMVTARFISSFSFVSFNTNSRRNDPTYERSKESNVENRKEKTVVSEIKEKKNENKRNENAETLHRQLWTLNYKKECNRLNDENCGISARNGGRTKIKCNTHCIG